MSVFYIAVLQCHSEICQLLLLLMLSVVLPSLLQCMGPVMAVMMHMLCTVLRYRDGVFVYVIADIHKSTKVLYLCIEQII